MTYQPTPLPPARFSLSAASMNFALAFAVALATALITVGGLVNRVQALESEVAPLKGGKLAVVEERVENIRADVAWIRERLERADTT